MVGDLPAGVARQWRRWGTHPEYLLSEGEGMRRRYEAVKAPVLGLSFADDAIITKPAIDQLHAFYRNAAVERRHLAPEDAGRQRIGHFGFFLPDSRDNLWRDALQWLRDKTGGRGGR
jgi:predicted alpha/beta hydrolase